MPFILSAQREPETVVAAFRHYREYLDSCAQVFPRAGHELACSEWYFDPREHRCPHDAWLEAITISEPASGEHHETRHTAIRLRLLGAFHDGFIEFFYPQVFSYSFTTPVCGRGLGDWRYDEFRVTSDGHLLHEIEWTGFPREEGSHWIIEASDVEFQWIPK